MQGKLLSACLLWAFVTEPVWAVTVAADNATDAAYGIESGGAWTGLQPSQSENPPGMDNGGYGFQPWSFRGGFHDGSASPYGNLNHFIDGIDFARSSFNDLGGPAFGLTNANTPLLGFTTRATRVFSQPLAVGGSVSVAFDNPELAPLLIGDLAGFIIRLNSGAGAVIPGNPDARERFGMFATGGFNQENWNLADASGESDTGLNSALTTGGAIFRLSLETTETYHFEILPIGGGNALYSASGSLANTGAGGIDTLEIVMFGNGSGNGLSGSGGLPTGEREFFFDELTVDDPQVLVTGDYNRDGTVDTADYVIWRNTMGQAVPSGSGADGDRDGVVGQTDYEVWRLNYGDLAGTATAQSNSVPMIVPEPDFVTLFGLAVLSSLPRRAGRPELSVFKVT